MASYKKAIELGADFLEVDIHLSKMMSLWFIMIPPGSNHKRQREPP